MQHEVIDVHYLCVICDNQISSPRATCIWCNYDHNLEPVFVDSAGVEHHNPAYQD